LLASKVGPKAVLSIIHIKSKKRTIWHRSAFGFHPTFGPVGTIVGGPATKPPAIGKGLLSQKKRSKLPRKGLFLFGKKKRSFLYPGWRPQYSPKVRRMVFRYQGILYIWNPLAKKRKKSLLLLSRGVSPRWAPNGRALAFLQKPFLIDAKGKATGGGIRIVDMLFRAAKVSKTGGQIAWRADSRAMAYVAKWNATHGIYWLSFASKGKTALPLVQGGQKPAFAPSIKPFTSILAYQTKSGVWLIHRKTRKKKLLVAGASHPQWGHDGRLLVRKGQSIQLLRISSTLLTGLAR
jgi:hypothetical protein